MAHETKGQYDPVCPYCGYKHRDAWEWGGDDFHECHHCRRMFSFESIVDVTYNTGPSVSCLHCRQWVKVRPDGNLAYHHNHRKAAECAGSKKPAATEGSADAPAG
jgi:hypothetical protein